MVLLLLQERESLKRNKYHQQCLPEGEHFRFVPLVLEHFGRWGVQAETYLDELSRRAFDCYGGNARAAFKSSWRERCAVQLQKCNAQVIYRKFEDLASRQSDYQYVDHFRCLGPVWPKGFTF